MPKFAELLEIKDPHTMVAFSTSDDVLRLPSVIKLYEEKQLAPVDGVEHCAPKNRGSKRLLMNFDDYNTVSSLFLEQTRAFPFEF